VNGTKNSATDIAGPKRNTGKFFCYLSINVIKQVKMKANRIGIGDQ
jgi:hypothetical protein